jgi:hypothetical protein
VRGGVGSLVRQYAAEGPHAPSSERCGRIRRRGEERDGAGGGGGERSGAAVGGFDVKRGNEKKSLHK